MIAAVHISPIVTLPVALLTAAMLAWYWVRLSSPAVPSSRRRRRRVTILMLLVSLALLVAGLSFIDPRAQQVAYITLWSVTLLLMLLIFAAACVDAVLTVRVDQYEMQMEHAIRRARASAEADSSDERGAAGEEPER